MINANEAREKTKSQKLDIQKEVLAAIAEWEPTLEQDILNSIKLGKNSIHKVVSVNRFKRLSFDIHVEELIKILIKRYEDLGYEAEVSANIAFATIYIDLKW